MRRYFFDDPTMVTCARFARVTAPLLAVGFDDDPWETPPGIDLLVGQLTHSNVERRQFSPSEAGTAIGHMVFFRRRNATTLWTDVSAWLKSHK